MAYFKISEPNKPIKYIKDVNHEEETLTFQPNCDGAYYKDRGFYATAEYDFLMYHFKEKYPELEYMTCTY